MSFVLTAVSPQNLMNWIKANDPTSVNGTVGDSWRKYLSTHGGVGKTLYDLETSYLTAQAIPATGTLRDRWEKKLVGVSGKSAHEQARTYFK